MSYGGYQGYYQQPMGPKPDNNLVWAILSTLFCCLPFGIVSIVFAAQVDSKYAMGDYAGAVDSAQKARMWALVSVGATVVAIVAYIVFFIVLLGGVASTSG